MVDIRHMNIRTKDLNLLAVFVGIAEELNLSRASERLGLSQPALSHALARLRVQFEDPLFVRGQRGLVATPRVSVLLPKVRAVLGAAERLYGAGEALNLATVERRVVIASTAYFEVRAMAGFIQQAQTEAPKVRVETRSLSGEFPKRELESGEFDLAVAAYFQEVPESFKIRTIFSDRFVCVCSRGNAYLKTQRALADYLGCNHLQIEVPPGVFAPVDQCLQGRKKVRNIALRIGNFLTPPGILAQTGLLLTCPASLAEEYARTHALEVSELPFRLPSIETKMIWHEKNDRDPFHQWLRGRFAEAEGLAGPNRA